MLLPKSHTIIEDAVLYFSINVSCVWGGGESVVLSEGSIQEECEQYRYNDTSLFYPGADCHITIAKNGSLHIIMEQNDDIGKMG